MESLDQASLIEFGNSLKWYLGFVVIANLGTIGSLVFAGFRATWFVSKMHSQIEKAQDTAIRAHKRIDKIEDKI